MDREGFRNRLKQYKEARGLNPLLKYWDWRLRYEVSTEENPIYYNELEDLNNQLSEIEPLLNERKNIEQALINKRLELSKKHKVPYLKDKEIILTNAGSMTGARLTTNLLDSIAKYANKTGLPLQEAVGLAALETTFGQNIRMFNKIRNNSNYDDYCVEDILSDWRYKSKDVNEYLEKKLNAPSAEAARLQKESFDYTMSKTHRMSAEEYEKAIILDKRALLLRAKDLIDFIINNYNDFEKAWTDYEEKTVSPFEHAFEYYKTGKYNPADSTHTDMVKLKGEEVMLSPEFKNWLKQYKDIPKYGDGTNFVTYDPDELQRNIQRVLHTTPEGEVNPFYNSLDDTYGSVELPEITVTAPYTRKASLAQQARLGREAYYKAGQKAAPVLAAIPLGAGILGAASMFGFGPVLDILDVASDPTNPLSYVDKFDLSKIKVGPSRAEKLGRFLENEPIGQPVNVQLSPKTSTYVPSKDHAKTSLKFFERPSKLTQEELDGLSKHYRDRSKHSEKYGTDFGEYDIRTQRSDSPIFSEFVGDGSESAVFSSKNNKWVYKIYDGASFNDLDELRKWTNNFLLRNKIDFAEPITYKGFVTSKLGIHPVFRQKKLTPISWNDPKAIDILNKIREMYKNAGWDDRMIKDGLQLNDMQIQNFAYDKLGNLKAIDVDVYPVNGLADGGEVGDNADYRQQIINRADYVASNYDDARDFDLNPLVYTFRKFAKDNFDRGGISNCTLSATGWIDPNNQYMSAKNIFNNPSSGYTEIDAGYALPGDLLIAKNPEKNSYHTMLIEGFNGNEPILRYSRGGHNTKENLVTGRPLAEYHELDNKQGGNHTEDHYFRYNIPNEYWLPELIVTPNKR